MDGMLDLREAAAQLSVAVSTVRRLVISGTIEAMRVGRQLRIAPQQLENYIKNNQLSARRDDE